MVEYEVGPARDGRSRPSIFACEAVTEIIALKDVVTSLQKTVEQLQAAQKAAGDKKPEAK